MENESKVTKEPLYMIIKNIGFILLSIYLILTGVALLAAIAIPSVVMGLIALLAGIFILIGR